MTAHAMKGDRERCLEAGMDGYVTKPLSAARLFETIESVMRAATSAAGDTAAAPPPEPDRPRERGSRPGRGEERAA